MGVCTIYTFIVSHHGRVHHLHIHRKSSWACALRPQFATMNTRVAPFVHITLQSRDTWCLQGGIKAVIWTDAFQAAIMVAGLLAVIVVVSGRKPH